MGLDGIGVDTVIELGEGAVEIPGEGEAAVFVVLEALEFLDEVEFEFRAEPGAKFKSDILVGIRAAIAASAGGQSLGPSALDPSLGGQEETVATGLISNFLEFEGIKTRVMNPFPDAKEEHGVLVFEPLLDERAAALEVPYHVGE